MGSEMCIRDRDHAARVLAVSAGLGAEARRVADELERHLRQVNDCLLYTSDAADERSSVDLGGRRIIKKKKTWRTCDRESTREQRHQSDTRK